MFIIPMSSSIQPLPSLSSMDEPSRQEQEAGKAPSFFNVFQNALQDVQDANAVSEQDAVNNVLGSVSDLHTTAINTRKAYLALQTFVTIKNTAIDAYKEIMNTSV